MKKKFFYGTLLVVFLISSVFSATKAYSLSREVESKEEALIISKSNYPEVYDYIDALTVDSFEKRMNQQDSFYVYVGRPTCGDCNDFEPKLIKLIKDYDLHDQLQYLNVAKLRTQEKSWVNFKETYNLVYTPTLAKIEQGKLVSKVEWTPEAGISISDVEEWIELNMIKNTDEK
ncbi:thioredoxin family protein [Enterococcus termitis]|uniref:Thiol reductase thioredoxin n=1 Tax=Enterococcus termitis TaxID=332950 RepID=A0A1E5H099_9ENTE|nr:thioredoxin family protein [Enterococcus termitis]OEG18414.1 thiol reductase thioredoxin [Enterococcus termitis]